MPGVDRQRLQHRQRRARTAAPRPRRAAPCRRAAASSCRRPRAPCRSGGRAARSPSARTIAASRDRSGRMLGTPQSSNAAAVTGPTQVATTSAWNAAATSSRRPVTPAASISAATARGRGERDRVELAVRDQVDHPEHRGRVLGAGDPVDRHDRDVRALAAQRVRRPSSSDWPCSWTTIRRPVRSRPRRCASTSSKHSDSGRPQLAQPLPRAGRRRSSGRGRGSPRRRSRPAAARGCPQRSAASNQAFMPMPVVARNMSIGRDRTSSVAARSCASSTWLRIQRQRRRRTRPGPRAARAGRPAPRPCGPR